MVTRKNRPRKPEPRQRCHACREIYPKSWLFFDEGAPLCFPSCHENLLKWERVKKDPPDPPGYLLAPQDIPSPKEEPDERL